MIIVTNVMPTLRNDDLPSTGHPRWVASGLILTQVSNSFVNFPVVFGGSLSFDHHSHDWEAFKVRLTQFCVANGVTDENDKISGVGALFSLRRSPKTQCEWRQVW
ncbi:hypothetical protein EVAR_92246_1 [Eumeta japonica]|uniref:Uncharacterized protein n=1 Tax=Eumeta variegata TaxID=151549 RepID=A0A4C1TNH9_EUMVA|nr:hypothetical protein EVAR_92246_1 [Eumeta japonica]